MTISQAGVDFIKKQEGLRLTAYNCSAGRATIGYGHTGADTIPSDVGKKTITLEQAEALLRQDLQKFEKAVSKAVDTIKLKQCQFDALVSLCYNIGISAFQKSTLLKMVKANANQDMIGVEICKWCNAGGKVSDGLKKRRRAEAAMYFNKGNE